MPYRSPIDGTTLTMPQLEGLYRMLSAADPDGPAQVTGVHGTLTLTTRHLAAVVGAVLQLHDLAPTLTSEQDAARYSRLVAIRADQAG